MIPSSSSLVWLCVFVIGLLLSVPLKASDNQSWQETGMHMRLLNDLDRPQDGWCLDVVGSGNNIRFDMPLIAHNCKPGLYADEAVIFHQDKTIRFPAYSGCMTAMGLNEYALPHTSLMIKPCGQEIPFLNAKKFQSFVHLENNQVRLEGTELCVVVGDVSKPTFDKTHRWRSLFLEKCDQTDINRSAWLFVKPNMHE